ncbi:MAG: PD40 domain-containing protein [Planctomycetes bacterium]|nr:PD40 domain-containing protein [Planctomycetota bacterium]
MRSFRRSVPVLAASAALALGGCSILRPARGPDGGRDEGSGSIPLWGPAGGFDLRQHTHGAAGRVADLDVSPRGDWIVFAWTEYTHRPKIFLQRTDRAQVVQKTFGDGFDDIDPTFSPDGERIAFASNREGNFNIYMIDAWRAGGAILVTSDPTDEIHPSFSPDGTRIAYAARGSESDWMIWMRDLRTQQATRLGPGTDPEWSPAGDRIAFRMASGREPERTGIWVVDIENGTRMEVVAPSGFAVANASWSPDGRSIAYEQIGPDGDARRRQIWAVDMETGTRIRLAEAEADDAEPAWGLDGRIYFASNRDGRWNIWSLNPFLTDRPVPAVTTAAAAADRGGMP